MSKKKVATLGVAAAVAASALVANNPASAASVSKAESAVQKAEGLAGQLKAFYSVTTVDQVKVSSDFQAKYNATKSAVSAAKTAVASAKGSEKSALSARLAKVEDLQLRAAHLIDAVKVGENEVVPAQKKLAEFVTAQKLDKDADAAYETLSAAILKQERAIGKVYGASARSAVADKYVLPAKITKETIIYEVSEYRLLNKVADLVKANKADEATSELAKLDRLKKRAVDIKAAGNKLHPGQYPDLPEVAKALAAQEKTVRDSLDAIVTPKVVSVSALNLKQVVVTFNQDVDATSAGTTGNYSFSNGSGITVTNADVEGKTVTLTVSGASQQQTSDLTVDGVKSAKGVSVAKTSTSVKFVDAVAPTVTSVTAVGPTTVKVKFSEPLQSVPTFSLNDGTVAIVNTSFQAGDTEATLTLGTAPTSGTYNLKVSGGLDYAGFKVDTVTKEFNFAVDTTAPTFTVKSASPTQIVLKFNEDVTGLDSDNVEFYHTYNGVDAYKASKSVDGDELTLTFANPLPEGPFKLFLNYASDNGTQIADLWGNKVAEQTITGNIVSDTTAPTVTKVEASGNTGFLVTFSEAVSGATTAANYSIKDAAGNTVSISGAITNPTGNTYLIPVAALNGGSYTITVKGIKDTSINQNKLADYSSTVSIKDIVPPTVSDLDANTAGVQAQLLSAKKVKVVFSEVMDKASIENKLNYLFGGSALDSKVTVTAGSDNKSVVLDFTNASQNPAGATLQVLRVADAAGNPITAASTDVKVPATVSAPLFDKAEVTGKNSIKLYFKEVITSAQAADYLVTVDGTNYLTAGSITNEVVDGKSVITLKTRQDLPTTAEDVLVKTADTVTSKNSFGSLVNLSAIAPDDSYGPLATAAVAVDSNNNGKVDQFTVTFSENLYVASVQDSDFTVEGYEVTGVSVSGDTVTLSVKEKSVSDLTATPKVAVAGTVEDTSRNANSKQDALTAVAANQAN